jgi:hypothetical protein
MKHQKSGVIINFASIVAWVPMPGVAVYSAAKSAVASFTEALRDEVKGDGIDLRVFAPAHTNTGHAIQRPTRQTPETVAKAFLDSLLHDKGCVISDGALPRMKRFFPKATQKMMARTGLHALDIAYGRT